MKTYMTTALCPHCNKPLQTSDVKGYGFVCVYCDENFYTIEQSDKSGGLSEIIVTMNEITFAEHYHALQDTANKYKCDSFGNDSFSNNVLDFAWSNGFPDSDTINSFIVELNTLLKQDAEWI